MEKNKIIMLGMLVVIGVIFILAGSFIGINKLFYISDEISDTFCGDEASNTTKLSSNCTQTHGWYVIEDHEAVVYENGKIIGRFPLKEVNETEDECDYMDDADAMEEFFTLNLTKWAEITKKRDIEEAEREQRCTHKPSELLEIAKKDYIVRDLIAQKNYSVGNSYSSSSIITDRNNKSYKFDLSNLIINVNKEVYAITIDMNYEKVLFVRPFNQKVGLGPIETNETKERKPPSHIDRTPDTMKRKLEEIFEFIKNDEKIYNLTNGKNYTLHGWGGSIGWRGPETPIPERTVFIEIYIDENAYEIVVDLNAINVTSVKKKEGLKYDLFEIANGDIRVKKMLEGKYYEIADAERKNSTISQLMLFIEGKQECMIEIDTKNKKVNSLEGDC